ncbi:hypothetical protein [Solidesulfovibrio sp.]|uniref:hypothetical protein n=1 Tax=Solidesulfovibrio sp. TaxID=2910990 RepID=UPI002B21C0BD|nr:hypothetical protein [Solidesulfovibrio sp.]MEA4857017.1 hypothetical protein [Solidesulfovibrio sp.]
MHVKCRQCIDIDSISRHNDCFDYFTLEKETDAVVAAGQRDLRRGEGIGPGDLPGGIGRVVLPGQPGAAGKKTLEHTTACFGFQPIVLDIFQNDLWYGFGRNDGREKQSRIEIICRSGRCRKQGEEHANDCPGDDKADHTPLLQIFLQQTSSNVNNRTRKCAASTT